MKNTSVIHKPNPKTKYSIIIPAAGESYRMTSFSPKPNLSIGQQSLFNIQHKAIDRVFNKFEIILVTGFKSSEIDKPNGNTQIIENKDYKNTSPLYSIQLGLEACNTDRVLIIYGDLLFNKETITAPFDIDSYLLINEGPWTKKNVGCVITENKIKNMSYGIKNKWGQIAYLTMENLKHFKKYIKKNNTKNKFTFEALNYIINKGGLIKPYSPKNAKIMDIDSTKDLRKAQELL